MNNSCQKMNACPYKEYGMDNNDMNDWANFPIAMAYVPWQQWKCVYDAETGMHAGTIFPELELPFCGRKCTCGRRGDRGCK